MDLVDRINELCARCNTNKNALEKALDLGHGAIQKWKAHAPKIDSVQKVASYFGVTLDYLMTGESPAPDAPGSAHDGRETDLLKTFRRLDERGKRTVENAAQAALLEVTAPAQDMNDRATPPKN